MNTQNEALLWLRLSRVKGLGVKALNTIYASLAMSGLSLEDASYLGWPDFKQEFPKLDRAIYEELRCPVDDAAERELEQLTEQSVHVLHLGHSRYPQLVAERLRSEAPPLLFCHGYLELLTVDGVAIVGSRHASQGGLYFASRLAGELARNAINVISGYAAGVDTEAHTGALRADGTTTTVLSTGILHFRRKSDFDDLPWEGNVLAISQFLPRERWLARNAMVRNRVVCALSRAVVVVESGDEVDKHGRMSGTFDAAKVALRMGVPLFVLDSGAIERGAPGNARLISMGGRPVTLDDASATILARMQDQPAGEPLPAGKVQQARLL